VDRESSRSSTFLLLLLLLCSQLSAGLLSGFGISSGDGVRARYFKQVLLVSECNGRISELRSKGYDIETSTQKDPYGFAYHRLTPEGVQLSSIQRARAMCELFDAGAPADQVFTV
jgi:hypothetical protein